MANVENGDPKPKKPKYKVKVLKQGGKHESEVKFVHGPEKKVFVKKDVRTGDPNYGKESKTNPTPDFVKKAQKAGAEHAEKDGKSYVAGVSKTMKTPNKIQVKIKLNPHMAMHVRDDSKPTGKGKGSIKQAPGNPMKRRLERVAWLEGRNKRTESGFGR